MLLVSSGARPLACGSVLAAQKMQERCALKTRRPVRLPLLVHQQRKSNAGFVAKGSRVDKIAQANGRQPCPFIRKRLLVIAQLRDVLTAENSPVMAKEHDHGRAAPPQRAQSNRPPLAVRQHDSREPRAK